MDFLLHPDHYLEALGPIGALLAMGIIFAESGLFFGFFLPGDSLLLTAGLLAYKGVPGFNIWQLVIGFTIMAIIGDSVGYWFGNKVGPPIFSRPESRFFKPQNLAKAKEFYDKHGPVTLVLARFMPFIRTFAPIVAGAVRMNYRTFLTYNVVGAVLWGAGVTFAGYYLGAFFPPEVLDRYFIYIVLMVVVLSATPTLLHLWSENKDKILARVRRQPDVE
jgi:membrane-associated protein